MKEIGKVFSPDEIEDKWFSAWEDEGYFEKTVDESKKSFCILMPPPNVTGVLHMGHLLNQTLQDTFVRRARHDNKCAVWVAGSDHAGISMQVKVEKELEKEGIKREELGREKFLEYACEWRDKHGGIILSQLKKLGVSCDFKNKVHTLDKDYSRSVLTAFVELYKRGYIYRGKRIVNWCPVSQTALSDEEVLMMSQKSKLYYVKYEIVERPGEFIEIATTRPETIMGDVAVAVNPDDERYKHLIGLHCCRPLMSSNIPIIGDAAVEKDFGTGALKITPAHDKVDFEVGQRHNLPFIDVLNPDGTLNENAGDDFVGLDRFVAREKAAEILQENGLLIKVEDYENNVGFSERGHVPIEPRVSEQWFLKYPKIEEAKQAVSEGYIKFFPQRWAKTYLHWLENIQDWCVSRQLWWGHRIPVWYRKGADRSDNKNLYVSVEAPSDVENWEQDEDVLDTWASSWIWPLGVFGWPDEGDMLRKAFKYFYPTDVLITGPDIIFFWVARMIIASLEFMGPEKKVLTDDQIKSRIPFKNVLFTGIVRDKLGRKMSKSLGNSPEPLDLIKKYGADGLRFGLLLSAPSGQDLIFNEDNILLGRNFCNKLWNAFRFSRMNRDYSAYSQVSLQELVSAVKISDLDIDDYAILLNLVKFSKEFGKCLDNFEVNAALNLASTFFWSDYCSWYVEASKQRLHAGDDAAFAIHDIIMRQLLLMLNPIMPFITEELWHSGEDVVSSSVQNVYCETAEDLRDLFSCLCLDEGAVEQVEKMKEFVNSARRLLTQSNGAKSDISLKIFASDNNSRALVKDYMPKLKKLLGVEKISFIEEVLEIPSAQTPFGFVFLEDGVRSEVDVEKIQAEISRLTDLIKLNEAKLSNKRFIDRAPTAVVEGARKLLAENEAKVNELKLLMR